MYRRTPYYVILKSAQKSITRKPTPVLNNCTSAACTYMNTTHFVPLIAHLFHMNSENKLECRFSCVIQRSSIDCYSVCLAKTSAICSPITTRIWKNYKRRWQSLKGATSLVIRHSLASIYTTFTIVRNIQIRDSCVFSFSTLHLPHPHEFIYGASYVTSASALPKVHLKRSIASRTGQLRTMPCNR